MTRFVLSRRVGLLLTTPLAVSLTVALAGAAKRAAAQETAGNPAWSSDRAHRHDPIDIDSRPLVSKISISLVRPRRVLWDEDGTMYVADWAAGTVLRISPKGDSTVLAEELNQPSGLARDGMGNLYVTTFAQGLSKEGSVVRIGMDGMKTLVAVGMSGPSAVALDLDDNLYVASYTENSIVRITTEGEATTFVADIPGPSALQFDAAGNLLVLSSSQGAVYRITPMGEVVQWADGLTAPSDLLLHPGGHVVVVDFGRRRLVHITAKGKVRLFALVPQGTVAAAFDSRGNLVLANGDDHSLLKITSKLSIECPHCHQPIPLRLRARPKQRRKKQPDEPHSEEQPKPPVI